MHLGWQQAAYSGSMRAWLVRPTSYLVLGRLALLADTIPELFLFECHDAIPSVSRRADEKALAIRPTRASPRNVVGY